MSAFGDLDGELTRIKAALPLIELLAANPDLAKNLASIGDFASRIESIAATVEKISADVATITTRITAVEHRISQGDWERDHAGA